MLGERLVYSCGYWRDATDLDSAQEAKLDLVCRKLRLLPGMRVLDIGCGWGEALKFAVQRYGAGLGNYLTVLTAQTQQLTQERLDVDLKARAYDLDVSLARALGGLTAAAGLALAFG